MERGGDQKVEPSDRQTERPGMCGMVSVYIELSVDVLTVSSAYLCRNSLFLFLLAPHTASSHHALPEHPDPAEARRGQISHNAVILKRAPCGLTMLAAHLQLTAPPSLLASCPGPPLVLFFVTPSSLTFASFSCGCELQQPSPPPYLLILCVFIVVL